MDSTNSISSRVKRDKLSENRKMLKNELKRQFESNEMHDVPLVLIELS